MEAFNEALAVGRRSEFAADPPWFQGQYGCEGGTSPADEQLLIAEYLG